MYEKAYKYLFSFLQPFTFSLDKLGCSILTTLASALLSQLHVSSTIWGGFFFLLLLSTGESKNELKQALGQKTF